MARQRHMNPDDRIDHRFLSNFRVHLLWPVLAVIVFVIIGLVVLSPWADDNDSTAPALPTPVEAGTPSP